MSKSPQVLHLSYLPPWDPAGEDSVSFELHNNALKAEYRKLKPNSSVVNDLMSMLFTLRWEDLHTNRHDMETIFENYLFLRIHDQVWV